MYDKKNKQKNCEWKVREKGKREWKLEKEQKNECNN